MSVLFIIGMSRMDSYPFYCGHPDYIASIRTMSAIPYERGKNKIIAKKNFYKKKFDRSQHFKRKQLFIVVSKKKNIK